MERSNIVSWKELIAHPITSPFRGCFGGDFDVDACCDPLGQNALLPKFWSDVEPCQVQDYTITKDEESSAKNRVFSAQIAQKFISFFAHPPKRPKITPFLANPLLISHPPARRAPVEVKRHEFYSSRPSPGVRVIGFSASTQQTSRKSETGEVPLRTLAKVFCQSLQDWLVGEFGRGRNSPMERPQTLLQVFLHRFSLNSESRWEVSIDYGIGSTTVVHPDG